MSSKRKLYHELSSRQKYRRINESAFKLLDKTSGRISEQSAGTSGILSSNLISSNTCNTNQSAINDIQSIDSSDSGQRLASANCENFVHFSDSEESISSDCSIIQSVSIDHEPVAVSNESSTNNDDIFEEENLGDMAAHDSNFELSCDNLLKEVVPVQNLQLDTLSKGLCSAIKGWVENENTLKHACADRLLAFINNSFSERVVPLSIKTVINAGHDNSNYTVIQNVNGFYVYFKNWIDNLNQFIGSNYEIKPFENIDLHANIDGIPLQKCGKYTAYPILVSAPQFPWKIFCAAILCTNKIEHKGMPNNIELMDDFLNSVKKLTESGLQTKYGIINVKFVAMVCDAVARASLKEIKSHVAYSGCERCTVVGEHHCNTLVFPNTDSPKRTDLSFKDRLDLNHHKTLTVTPLEKIIGFNMVSGFVIDYMHCCVLGVMKRILNRLNQGTRNKKRVNLDTAARRNHDDVLSKCREYLPSECNRKLEGGLASYVHWKASELRIYLLYIGVIVLKSKKVVAKDFYKNYLKFCLAMRLLLSDFQESNLIVIEEMLIDFVKESSLLYGKSFISYNVHSLIHLVDDYKNFGNLENVSCFKYENYLGQHIKASVRAGFKPLHQISEHIDRMNSTTVRTHAPTSQNLAVRVKSKDCSLNDLPGECYAKILFKHFVINIKQDKDSWIKTKIGHIGKIQHIHRSNKGIIINIIIFKELHDLFKKPCSSSSFGIYKANNLSEPFWINATDVMYKVICVPYHTYHIAQVISHKF